MKTKKQYEMGDQAWIHLGNGKLFKGKIVDIFDLAHAGWSKDIEFYIVEIPTEIDPLLEVRTWDSISQDAQGPIGSYRELGKQSQFATTKYLGKVGIQLPTTVEETPVVKKLEDTPVVDDTFDLVGVYDPTPEEIHAAMERAEKANLNAFTIATDNKPKKRNFPPRGNSNAKKPRRTTM